MQKLFRKLVFIFGLPLLTNCGNISLGDSKIDGVVLDEITRKPIEGAIVTAQWLGKIHGIVQGSHLCYHVESVQTGANGEFVIPAWNRSNLSTGEKAVTEKKRYIIVYMEGYNNRGPVPLMDNKGVIRIPRAFGSNEKRIQDIGVGVDYGCGWEDGSNAKLNPLVLRVCVEKTQFGNNWVSAMSLVHVHLRES